MDSLEEGSSYGVHESVVDELEVIHVKLTDTASKFIEEFMKIPFKNSTNSPTIQINDSSGRLNIPCSSGIKSFSFGITRNLDSVSSLQCIKQETRLNSRSLSSLGSINAKLAIHATNESFAQTKEKMAIVEEDHKKVCAKEIKPGGPGIGKRIKKRIAAPARPAVLPLNKNSAAPSQPKPSPLSVFASGAGRERTVSPIPEKSSPVANKNPNNFNKTAAERLKSMKNSRSTVNKPSNSTQPSNGEKARPKYSVDPKTLPLRDRVVHLLAVRPYTKPELFLRLQRDGLDSPTSALDSVLLKTCTSPVSGKPLTLRPEALATAREDWPLYTAPDRQLLARNRQRALKQKTSNSTAGTVNSMPSLGDKLETSPQGGNTLSTSFDGRSKAIKRSADDRSDSATPLKQSRLINSPPKVPSHVAEELSDKSESQSEEDEPDYVRDFTRITTAEQRSSYKSIFQTDYNEYIRLHKIVDDVTQLFSNLEQQVSKLQRHTPEYCEVKDKIVKEYEKVKNSEFQSQRQRYSYLHKRLAHIKRLVADYDLLCQTS